MTMLLPFTVPLALLGTSFIFAVIELGLSGHIASFYTGTQTVNAWGYSYTVDYSVPGILAFIIFTSVWTLLVSGAAVALPWFFRAKAGAGSKFNAFLTYGLAGAFFVTMVFWLASFADIAAGLGGWRSYSDYLNAVIAFAVLEWLLFLALFIVIVLAACGVLESDSPAYRTLTKKEHTHPAVAEPTQMQMADV